MTRDVEHGLRGASLGDRPPAGLGDETPTSLGEETGALSGDETRAPLADEAPVMRADEAPVMRADEVSVMRADEAPAPSPDIVWREGRPDGEGRGKIVVTGIASRLGRLIARRLHLLGDYRIVGIDSRPADRLPKDIEHLQVDIRSKRARNAFRHDVVAVVHAGMLQLAQQPRWRSWNVLRTSRLLEYCEAYGVSKVVALSSAEVYGAHPGNDQFLSEEAPLLAASDYPALHELVTADMQATSYFWRSRGIDAETVVLRPVHILGGLHNRASNYLRLARIPVPMGYDPMVQVIHERDVVEAVVAALRPGAHGVFNITGPGEVPLHVILDELGKPVVRVPYTALRLGLRALRRFKLTPFDPRELSHLRFVGMVDGGRARQALGFRPRYSLRETIHAVLKPSEIEETL